MAGARYLTTPRRARRVALPVLMLYASAMLCGAHESVAGGLHLAIGRGRTDGCRAIQVFTKSSGQWKEPALSDAQIAEFRAARAAFGAPILAHTSYLINLATDQGEILQKSVDALVSEVLRCSALGIDYVVLHPGAHLGAGDDVALDRVSQALDAVHERTPGASARILLENTAGQGSCIGHKFEHLAAIFRHVAAPDRLGICFDTQHAYAAGYDLSTHDGYARTFDELDRTVGIGRLRAFHLNDSKKPLGSRVDRHEHVGEGNLGLATFWRLVNDPRFATIPGVLETEPRKEEEAPYKREVDLLTSLVGADEPAPPPPAPAFALEVAPAAAPKRKRR